MSALLRKEIRLVGPSWLLALLVMTSLWLIPDWMVLFPGPSVAVVPVFLAAAMPFLVAMTSMGRELNLGTFAGLMGLPVSRSRLWWTKVLVLAVALLLLFGLWVLAYQNLMATSRKYHGPSSVPEQPIVLVVGLFWLSAFAGGLWTVLVFRQMAAALWFSLLVPVGLFTLVQQFFDHFRDAEPARYAVAAAILLCYAAGSFVWAWRLFLRAQDTQWTGGTVALPGWRALFGRGAAGSREGERARGQRRPGWALLSKELQLQQGQMLLAALLGLFHLALLGVRHWVGPVQNGTLAELLFRASWGLWLVMPLLIGAGCVADERKLGTLEAAACLPVSRRSQFGIKLALVLLMSVCLGALVPWLLEGNDGVIGSQLNERNVPPWWAATNGLFNLIGLSTGIALIAFYASTMARNTLQALGLSVAGIVLVFVLGAVGAEPESALGLGFWRGPIFGYIAIFMLGPVGCALAYWNFRWGHFGQRLWLRNSVGLAGTLVLAMVVATVSYQRAWEHFFARESAHGPSVLTQAEPVAMTTLSHGALSLMMPGGRLSIHRFGFFESDGRFARSFRLAGAPIEAGSNWSSAAYHWGQAAAVRADGTLWASERPAKSIWNHFPLVQVGGETNWQQVVGTDAERGMILLLRRDGSLWRWGKAPEKSVPESMLSASEPVRLGSDSDWEELIVEKANSFTVYCRKRDGSMWALNPVLRFGRSRSEQYELLPGLRLEHRPEMDRVRWRSLTLCIPFEVGVRDDGTLWLLGSIPSTERTRIDVGWSAGLSAQLGVDSDWKAVTGREATLLALKSDGSLWRLDFSVHSTPVRVSAQSDWIAVDTLMGSLTALAADGSFWRWADPQRYWNWGIDLPKPYLGPSRFPQPAGNLLENLAVRPGKLVQ